MNARFPDDWTGGRRIVVGVDGSPNSLAALRRGAAHAAARHAELDVVHAVPSADPVEIAAGMDLINSEVSQAFPDGLEVPARFLVEPGPPGEVLVALSEETERLVIGARRDEHSAGTAGDGTVSRCQQSAWCPVDVCAPQDTRR
jgi:nucleotide-binding universal stress UspA family protein